MSSVSGGMLSRLMVLSIVSLVVAALALLANLSGLVRRPRIVAEWGYVQERPPFEGLSIIVTARRRSIEVDQIGLVMLPSRSYWRRRRRVPEWLHNEKPPRLGLTGTDLPKLLQDGESVRAFGELDYVIDEFPETEGTLYAFVKGSGMVYLARESKLRRRLAPRVGER